jgi:hypothetical protein
MMFADRSSAAVLELQRAFALDRAAAERLLDEAPLVVKRAATPEVAAALIDALGQMGAQVVLLPSAASAAREPKAEPISHAAPATGAKSADDAPAWGGLDLAPTPKAPDRPHVDWGAELAQAPPAAPAAARAPSSDDDAARQARLSRMKRAQARARELELERQRDEQRERRQEACAGAAAREDGPGEFDFGGSGDDASDDAADAALPALQIDTGLEIQRNTVSDAPARGPAARVPASPPGHAGGTRPATARPISQPRLEIASVPAPRRAPAPPPPPNAAVSMNPPLGLGRVPPLPSVHPQQRPAPPPPAAPPRAAAPARAQAAAPVPARRASAPKAEAVKAGGTKRAARSAAREATGRTAAAKSDDSARRDKTLDNYWSSRRVNEPEAPVRAAPAMPIPGPATPPRIGDTSAVVHAVLTATPKQAERSRALAAAELLAGVLVFVGGVYADNSVLAGSASPASIVLHGFAIFGVLTGLWGLRP